MLRAILGIVATIAGLAQTRQSLAGIADPPFRGRARHAPDFPGNRTRRHTGARQQHDPRTIAHPRLSFSGAGQRLQNLPFLGRQSYLRRNRNDLHPDYES